MKGLFCNCLIVPSKVSQVVFVSLVYNSALFVASCYCSLLLHVVTNLICIFSVSRQLVLLSALPKFLHSLCATKGVTGCSANTSHSVLFLPLFTLQDHQYALLYEFRASTYKRLSYGLCSEHWSNRRTRRMVRGTHNTRNSPPDVSAFSLWQMLACRLRFGGTQNLSSILGEWLSVRLLPGCDSSLVPTPLTPTSASWL